MGDHLPDRFAEVNLLIWVEALVAAALGHDQPSVETVLELRREDLVRREPPIVAD
jgi:hypothetical protein